MSSKTVIELVHSLARVKSQKLVLYSHENRDDDDDDEEEHIGCIMRLYKSDKNEIIESNIAGQ